MHDPLIPYSKLPKYECRIQELLCRRAAILPPIMSDCQMYLYEVVERVAGGSTDINLSRGDIEAEFESERKPPSLSFNGRKNFITDFCYNMVNLEDNEIKFLFCVDRGIFQFKDLGWDCPDGASITWNVAQKGKMKVGQYKDGEYLWDFSEVEELIAKSRAASQ